jgi:hypothetical protein
MRRKADHSTAELNMRAWPEASSLLLLLFYPSHTVDFDVCSAVTEIHDRMAPSMRGGSRYVLTRDAQITQCGRVLNRSACFAPAHLALNRFDREASFSK